MKKEIKYNYEMTTKSGSKMQTQATTEEKARTSFLRKRRGLYGESYSSVYQGVIVNLGPTEPILSKAAAKRQKDAREGLVRLLESTLCEFKDRYLGSYTDWCKTQRDAQHKIVMDRYQATLDEHIAKGEDQSSNYVMWMERAEKANSLVNTHLHSDIVEAMNGYNEKFERMVDKLMINDFTASRTRVEHVRNMGSDLEFLIVNDQVEVHARVIFACGEINAPHYRFITTVRTK
jgi:hypothetical protein